MVAYNNLWLHNLWIQEQATGAYQDNCISREELEGINSNYPVHFYTPNFFIRIGLFILTLVIILFSFGIFVLLFLNSIDKVGGGLSIFFAILTYGVLEYMVRSKKHYQSGVDDALLWISASALFGGISYLSTAGEIANCILIFFISFYAALRFADRVMSLVAYLSLLGIFFYTCIEAGPVAKAIIPFLLMVVSLCTYFVIKKLNHKVSLHIYRHCFTIIIIASLITFYFSGNYYVVRELSDSLFNLQLRANDSIPFGWLFWIFTIAIPLLYMFRGIQKKDVIFIRVGLLLIAAIIFTVRYYYPFASVEVIMTFAGIILVSVCYWLMQYLKSPKRGYTYLDIEEEAAKDRLKLESLLLAQTFAQPQSVPEGTSFGGGSFGGGGSSGEF